MVDRLRNALENLEPPHCPHCRTEMKWFRSQLVHDIPTSVVAHEFVYPGCGRTGLRETQFKAIVVPPDKLSAPRSIAKAA